MSVKPIPAGYHAVTPYLVVRDVERLIAFARQAFGAELSHDPLTRPDGTITHAEIRIGDSRIMMGAPAGEFTPMPVNLYLYVERVDDTYARALQAGATPVMAPADQFLRRPPRRGEGRLRQRLVDRHPYRGRRTGGARQTCRRGRQITPL